ncbi:MAG: SbcC/MukB-like Walker B domain-containing protein, partial [Thiolinea sp.]
HKQQQDDLTVKLKTLADNKKTCEARIAETDLVALEQLQHRELSQYADKQQFRDLLRQAMAALKEWRSLLAQASKTQAQQTEMQNTLSDLQQNLKQLSPELQTLRIRHAECEHLVQKSREVMQLSDYRAELRPNEACPLCGSPDHPYASDNPLAEGLLHTQQQHLKTLTEELKQCETQHNHLEHSIPQEQQRLSACQEELEALQQQISATYQRYAILFESLRLADTLNEQADQHTLEKQLRAWEQELDEGIHDLNVLEQTNEQRAQQIKQARTAQDELLALQEQENGFSTALHTLNQQDMQWQERLQSLDTQHTMQSEILQTRTEALNLQLADNQWQQSLQELGEQAFIAQLEARTRQYRQDQQALADAEQQYSTLAPKIAATQQTQKDLNNQLTQLAAKTGALTEQKQVYRKQRETLVTEQDLGQLERKHQQTIENAQQNVEKAQTLQHEASEKLATMQATLKGLEQQLTEATTNHERLQQTRANWQQKLALDDEQLSELLAHDDNWLRKEREDLNQLAQNAASAKVTLQARRQDLQEQENLAEASRQWLIEASAAIATQTLPERVTSEHAPAEDDEQQAELQTQLATHWQQQKDELDEQIFQYRQQLSADAQAREKAGHLTHQLTAQQERYELWEKMNELIGSANGSKFRNLAQSLTLQQLVVLANQHLQDLAPRYALQPVPGSGLALQVIDHDMGDEVRSVESLSGGESFLVSLALALALASLAADTRQLGSLFIDEGFGTLDPDSLEMALACLDALQADGRQIGVISHVSTLVERIGVQIKVESMGGGQSRVVVHDR